MDGGAMAIILKPRIIGCFRHIIPDGEPPIPWKLGGGTIPCDGGGIEVMKPRRGGCGGWSATLGFPSESAERPTLIVAS